MILTKEDLLKYLNKKNFKLAVCIYSASEERIASLVAHMTDVVKKANVEMYKISEESGSIPREMSAEPYSTVYQIVDKDSELFDFERLDEKLAQMGFHDIRWEDELEWVKRIISHPEVDLAVYGDFSFKIIKT